MESKKRRYPLFVVIFTIIPFITISFYDNNYVYGNDYLKIIDHIYSDNGSNIRAAVALWGKGDDPLISQLYSNFPLESKSFDIVSKYDNPQKYNLIMELIKEVPKLKKSRFK